MNDVEFYINSYSFVYDNDTPDLSFIPMLFRRKLSKLNKAAFYTLNNCYSENIQNIIFTSQNGEMDRLISLINQHKEDNEVSPSVFSTSVHNATVGMFSLLKKYNNNYTALSANKNSFSVGLLNAIIDENDEKLFCYADTTNIINSICINISRTKKQNSKKYILRKNTDNTDILNEAEKFIYFLKGENHIIHYPLYTIERINND